MKKILSVIAIFIASAFSILPTKAQGTSPKPNDTGVVLNKYLTGPDSNGQYLITLEAYATGESVTSSKPVPCDIVLVLDVSTSMASAVGESNVLEEMQELTTGDHVEILHTDDYNLTTKCCYKTIYHDRLRYQVQIGGTGSMYNLAYFEYGKPFTYYYSSTGQSIRKTSSPWNGDSGWYYNSTMNFRDGAWQNDWQKYTPNPSDIIYTDVKIDLLQKAVNSFISEIRENARTNNVDHKIGVATFCGNLMQYRYLTSATNDHFIVNPQGDTEEQTMSEFVQDLHNHMDGNTDHSVGMSKAEELYKTLYGYPTTAELATALNSEAAKNRSQVVVLFTDGDPNASQTYRITNTLASSYRFKTAGATVYSVGIFTDKTIDNTDIKLSEFLDYTSSDYPNATEYGKYGNPIEGHDTNTHKYYFKAEGADLSSIFEAISRETTGGSTKVLDSETTTVVDVLTADFVLPVGTDESKIGLFVDSVTEHSFDTDGKDVYKFGDRDDLVPSGKNREDYVSFANATTSDGKATKKIVVTGFDFTKDDKKEGEAIVWTDDGEVEVPGNWVGPRVRGVGSQPKYYGRRLVITIPIETAPDYQGGYSLPTNTADSGIYSAGTQIDVFPVPDLDFPSIGIIKRGLKKGESATFTVQRIKDEKGAAVSEAAFNIILTGSSADGSAPAYTVLKDLNEGTYRVAESKWSWTYNVTEVTVKDGEGSATITPGEGEASASTQVLAKSQTVDWPSDIDETAKCVLFTFTNAKKSGDDSTIYAESVVKNQFKGGSVTTTGSVTTNSKAQPGETTSNQ